MLIGCLGDVHGNFEAVDRAMRSHPDALWLCVGDVEDENGAYPDPVAPFYFIQGNNEDFDFLTALRCGRVRRPNLRFLANGSCTTIGRVRVAALGGTFAPKWFETPARDLPFPGGPAAGRPARDDKRRHFVHEEVDAIARAGPLDILLTHEAARPFLVETPRGRVDAGKTPVNELLAAVKPRLHLFGHHHRPSHAIRQGVPSIGLDLASRSYVLVDGDTFEWRWVENGS